MRRSLVSRLWKFRWSLPGPKEDENSVRDPRYCTSVTFVSATFSSLGWGVSVDSSGFGFLPGRNEFQCVVPVLRTRSGNEDSVCGKSPHTHSSVLLLGSFKRKQPQIKIKSKVRHERVSPQTGWSPESSRRPPQSPWSQ